MKKNFFKIVLIILLFVFPLLSLSALNLEYTYPPLPGTSQTITINSTLGEVIKYVLGIVILIGGLVAFLSLIYAGISYLTSSGQPEKLREAKNRIFNSFLGLIILIGSYLVLLTVNPQLLIVQIKKTPLETGLVLLSNEGLNNLKGISSPERVYDTLNRLINSKKAIYLNYSLKNLKNIFGNEFTEPIDSSVYKYKNFKNFQLAGIGFLKKRKKKIKLITYSQPNFKGNNYEYVYLDEDNIGKIKSSETTTTIIEIDKNQVIKVPSENWAIKIIEFNFVPNSTGNSDFFMKDETYHPPLSILLKGVGPGIYLYSTKIGEKNYEERYFISSKEDFRASDIEFNDKAKYIEIKNDETNDYLAILYNDTYFSDKFRIFFEKKERASSTINLKNESKIIEPKKKITGNVEKNQRLLINETDRYGEVKKVSSLQVFQLNDEANACDYVELCQEKEFLGKCLYFLNPDRMEQEINNIIEDIKRNSSDDISEEEIKKETEERIKNYFLLPIYDPISLPEEFNDNIRSLKIEGNCLVVLFENKPKIDERNVFWEKNSPGKRSQVFIKSDLDLTDDSIGRCGTFKIGRLIPPKPCASAIAIYPLKPLE